MYFWMKCFYLPSNISLNPVKDEISWHLNFNFLIALKVPPELKISILNFFNVFNNFSKLLLSDTEIIALSTFF